MFAALDFLYIPSRDVAGDLEHFTARLGGEVVFAIEAFSTRVAMVRLHDGAPAVLLAGHLEGEAPILVYRVEALEEALAELGARGIEVVRRFEMPHGPGAELSCPGPQRVAVYELTRREARERLTGRRDF